MLSKRSSRQSFLGADSDQQFAKARVGIVGLGGGGSHFTQQFAHIGFKHYAIYDPDRVDSGGTNLNRLVGANIRDRGERKTDIAKRVILGLVPDAQIIAHDMKWQDAPDDLRQCDIVIGCVDTYAARRDLEAFCRRYLIVYIDIGMDVITIDPQPPRMVGQVIASMPGCPCLHCFGFLTEETLAKEAAKYGDVGGLPQVIWPNGVLASTAVGMAVNLLTNWTRSVMPAYLQYDGNTGVVTPHVRLQYLPPTCTHYPLSEAGDPIPRKF